MKTTILVMMTIVIGCNGYRGYERSESTRGDESATASETPKPKRTTQKTAARPRAEVARRKAVQVAKKPAPKIIKLPETVVQPEPKVDMSDWKKKVDGTNTFLCTDIIADKDTKVVFTLKFTQEGKDLFTKVFPVELKKSEPKSVRIPYEEPSGKYGMHATLEFKKPAGPPVAVGK